LLGEQYVSDEKLEKGANFLQRVTTGQLSTCSMCGIKLQTLLLMPCVDLICTECVEFKCVDGVCGCCGSDYDIDEFQVSE